MNNNQFSDFVFKLISLHHRFNCGQVNRLMLVTWLRQSSGSRRKAKSSNYDVNRNILLAANEELWRIVIWKYETDTEYFAKSQGLALQLIYNQALDILQNNMSYVPPFRNVRNF